MNPEMSLVLLTVLSGIGQGIFIFLVAGDFKMITEGGSLPNSLLVAGSAASLLFTIIGAIASLFHLGNPERGWRAILQWKSSWLSREAILLPAFQCIVFLYGLTTYMNQSFFLRAVIGIFGVTAAIAIYLSSGMVYAKIRFVREWSSIYTPINFTIIGFATGSVTGLAIIESFGVFSELTAFLLCITLCIIAASMILKILAYLSNSRIYSTIGIQNAMGINCQNIRLMDFGASYDHYNTNEYSSKKYRNKFMTIKGFVIVALFIAPLLFLIIDYISLSSSQHGFMAPVTAVFMTVGAIAELWLFFAEGNHIQNLYYGNFIENKVTNPILQPAKKGTPIPL